jgi:HK97 family phage portal protein
MKIFGRHVPFTGRRESTAVTTTKARNLSSVAENRGWFRVFESFPGAWQRNITIDRELVLSHHAVYACITLIAADIAKLRIKLVEQQKSGIWKEVSSPAFSPVLRKPNKFQNRIQFIESWILSKLMRGNTYVLKVRDNRDVVIGMYVLDPQRVVPMVTDVGDVYYQLQSDNIAGIGEAILVPASEIIHDRMNCLFHPLVGTSPIYASALSAMQGLNIQHQSTKLYENNAQPGGILTAAGNISEEAAKRLKEQWTAAFAGENSGRVAVLGEGLSYTKLSLTAVEGQLIEQLEWSSQVICSTFHVPPYKIGIGEMPAYNNIQALNIEYYSQCLQSLIEALELCLDEGLGLDTPKGEGKLLGTELDIDNLLRMDSVSQMEVVEKGVKAMVLAPNDGRLKLGYEGVEGGDSPLAQQQNYSLAALAKRDAKEDPFATSTSAPTPAEPKPEMSAEDKAIFRVAVLRKELGLAA